MSKRFLLVDDDNDDIELFFEALKSVDDSVVFRSARNGYEAFMQLSETDTPDIIFLDINMPRIGGWEFLAQLKNVELYKNIPVVMYSTSSNKRDIDMAQKLGAVCFLVKPAGYEELEKSLQLIVAHINNNTLRSAGFLVY